MRLIIRLCLLILIMVTLISCDLPTDDDDYIIPEWQEAIFTVNNDGTQIDKQYDIDGVNFISYIPNSSNYLVGINIEAGYSSVYVINPIDSTKTLISGDIKVKRHNMTLSENGDKVVFWGIRERIGKLWDLYLYDFDTNSISNLTYTHDKAEHFAIFVDNDPNSIIYMSYWENSIGTFASINILNLADNSSQVVFTQEIQGDFGFFHPIYDSIHDVLFFQTEDYELCKLTPLINGNISVLSNAQIREMKMIKEENKLYYVDGFDFLKLLKYDTNTISTVLECSCFDINGSIIVYTDSYYNFSDNINLYDNQTNETITIEEKGMFPRFSNDGEEIIYFGSYRIR